jgi:DNA-binding MarR family transcriptional regulator
MSDINNSGVKTTDSSPTLSLDGEKASGGYFVQVPVELLKSSCCSPSALKLYLLLLSYCGRGETAWPGQARLATEMNLTDRRVRVLLDELEKAGLVTVSHRYGKTNLYRLQRYTLRARQDAEQNYRPNRNLPSSENAINRNLSSAESHAVLESESVEIHSQEDAVCAVPVEKEPVSSDTSRENAREENQEQPGVIQKTLQEVGIWPGVAAQLALTISSNGRDTTYISLLKNWIKQQTNLTNPAGYLASMIRQNCEPPVISDYSMPNYRRKSSNSAPIDWSKYREGGKYAYLARS